MSDLLDLSLYVRREGANSHMDLALEGVTCAGCIRKIENGLRQLSGIVDARVNFTNRRLAVEWQDGAIEPESVIRAIERIGFRAHPFVQTQASAQEGREAAALLKCLAVAGFGAMNIMLLSISIWSGSGADMSIELRDLFHWISALIALPAVAYAGRPFFQGALRAICARALNMDVPISLGLVLALAMSVVETAQHGEHAYFDSAAMLLFFLLCGRYLDLAVRRRTRAFAFNLAALKAEVAHRFERGGELVTVPVAALQPGDRLLVRPGERIAADGVIISGRSKIDESLVTGETEQRKVAAGDKIYAGTINYSGALTMRVTAAAAGTLIEEIERLLAKALTARSRHLRLADRAASAYAPLVHAAAGLTLIGWLVAGASAHDAVITAIAVLIITCPCAIALAVPAVQVTASGALFRAGVLLNGGDAIERLAEIDTVVFDKTGTLTLPEPRVEGASGEPGLIKQAARLALSSHHPLARAVALEACAQTPIDGAVEEPGHGVRAVIDGTEARLGSAAFCDVVGATALAEQPDASVICFRHGERSAGFLVRQKLRPDAASTVAALRQLGLELIILSGDRTAAVAPVAAVLGVRKWEGRLTPSGKIRKLDELKAAGHRVLMVGDGLNDAPALAAAHVSLSPITAAELSQTHADGVFLGERLEPVLRAVAVARRARRLMRQNLWLAGIYNALAVPIAVAGFATPLFAALAMSGSSMLVTLNALRLRAGAAGHGGAQRRQVDAAGVNLAACGKVAAAAGPT
jgi:Cu2+-exporting ATPase